MNPTLSLPYLYLPRSLTPFIGRTQELGDLLRLLMSPVGRLVSVVAPGGMGKTRLALAAASQLQDEGTFADGVHFISLLTVGDAQGLVTAIASTIGYTFHQDQSAKEQLLAYTSSKRLLLILDNFEHLPDECRILVGDLLVAAPGLRVMITSRERLNISAETVFSLKGMHTDAEQLFLQTAQRAKPGFTPDAAQVARICQLVGGMPLGVILSAALVDTLSLEEITDEINRDTDFLQTQWHDVPERQTSLKEILHSAWSRLSENEQQTFMQLAVFRGGFTREVAQVVSGATLQTIKTLVNRSLLWRDSHAGRYEIHELLRQYAEKQLKTVGQYQSARDAHKRYFTDLLGKLASYLRDQRQLEAIHIIASDLENIRFAWQWALVQKDYATLNVMLEPVTLFFDLQSHWSAGEDFLRRAHIQLTCDEAPDVLQARVAIHWVDMLLTSKSHAELTAQTLNDAKRLSERSLSVLRDQMLYFAQAQLIYGHLLSVMEELPAAMSVLSASLNTFCELEDHHFAAQSFHMIGYIYVQMEDIQKALEFSKRGAEMQRSIGDEISLSAILINVGSMHMWESNYGEARIYFDEALQLGRKHNNWSRILWGEQCLGSLAFHLSSFSEARIQAQKVIEIAEYYGHREGIALGSTLMAQAMLAEGDYVSAWQRCADCQWLHPVEKALGLSMAELGLGDYRAAREHVLTVLRDAKGSTRVYALRNAANLFVQQGDLQQAVELLSLAWHYSTRSRIFIERVPLFYHLRAYLEAKLSPNIFASAWEHGKILDVDMTAQMVLELLEVQMRPAATRLTAVSGLSGRELEILSLVADGLSNQDIAEQLIVSLSTVKKHITHIYSKLAVNSRTQALLRAREVHLL